MVIGLWIFSRDQSTCDVFPDHALHPVLPALTATRALWSVWHQAWVSCMEKSLGETTHSCRSSLSLLLRSSGVKEAEVPTCRNCSPFCWVLAFKQDCLLVFKCLLKKVTCNYTQSCPSPWFPGALVFHIQKFKVSLLLDTSTPLGHQELWQFLSFHSVFPKSLRSASEGKRPKKERLRTSANTRKEPLPHSTHSKIIPTLKQ